jgi:CRP/FNR family transcriptional regulator
MGRPVQVRPGVQTCKTNNGCTDCPARKKSFCAGVSDANIKDLARARQRLWFGRRQTIISQGDPATSFLNITRGVVKVYRSSADGRTQIIGFRGPGQFVAISGGTRHSVSAEALTNVEVCRFSGPRLSGLLRAHSNLLRNLLELSYRQMADAENQIVLLGRKSAEEKVASFLLNCGGDPRRGDCLDLPMRRSELADYLGLTTETVSRVLARLVRAKILAIGRSRKIYFVDPNALLAICASFDGGNS